MVQWLVCVLICFVIGAYGQGTTTILPGYNLENVQSKPWGYEGDLVRVSNGPYGGDINNLKLFVYYQTTDTLRVKIIDPNNERWEVPDVIQQQSPPQQVPSTTAYKVAFTGSPFGISVYRTTDNQMIWNTTSPNAGKQFNGLIYEDQYIEWSTQTVSKPNIYGLGERVGSFLLDTDNNDFVMFNLDQGTPPNTNLYGTHPMYMEIRQSPLGSTSHGVFFLNSNAMNVHVEEGILTYQTIGGVLDVWFMLGPSPRDVIQQYLAVVGKPHMPPYWELGFHQCRWGYVSIQETASVAFNYQKYEIPLDTMWNDIDYMDAYRDFTNDPINYPLQEYQEFVNYLHDNGQHYVHIVDPGIMVDPTYSSYIDGLEANIFIKQADGKEDAVGKVWPGYTTFPDFSNPGALQYWQNQINSFRSLGIEVDGLWIDMNEISNFCTGNCFATNSSEYTLQNDPYDNPPFFPTSAPLNTSTISMNTQTYLGVNYNTHDLYAFYEAMVTNKALENIRNERSFVLSRSSFAGSGKYTSHWLGDNTSTWTDLYESIAGILNFQMFGIPMVGVDICGFNGNTTVELCSRWMQLGSFYPFSRNHNSIGSIPQEPWAFDSPQHIQITRNSLLLRYSLLPYFYTLAANAAENGSTIWNALIWIFPNDPTCLAIDSQFMVGESLLVSPALQEGQVSVNAYFPASVWYDWETGLTLGSISEGTYVQLDAPITKIPVAVKGGSILPLQVPSLTTTRSRNNPFVLVVALDESGDAEGNVYLDDGISLDSIKKQEYSMIEYHGNNGSSVSSTVIAQGYDMSHLYLNEIKVFGVSNAVTSITVNGLQTVGNFVYNQTSQVLQITGLVQRMDTPFTVEWF